MYVMDMMNVLHCLNINPDDLIFIMEEEKEKDCVFVGAVLSCCDFLHTCLKEYKMCQMVRVCTAQTVTNTNP